MLHHHDNWDPEAVDPYPDSVNVMVFDRQRAEFTGAEFFYPLLIDQVTRHAHSQRHVRVNPPVRSLC